eukprot:gene18557-25066_t
MSTSDREVLEAKDNEIQPNADTLARWHALVKMKFREGSACATTEVKRKGKRYYHERSTLLWKLSGRTRYADYL